MGPKGRRMIDDEHYLQAILARQEPRTNAPPPCLVDVRTKANANAHKAKGGGFEADGPYGGIRMFFTAIDDVQGIRDAHGRVLEGIY